MRVRTVDSQSQRRKPAAPTREVLDSLYRTVNSKFADAAELRLEAGRELLSVLFGDDAALALSAEAETHAPWVAFRQLAGARKVKPSRRQLREALRLAAWERRIEGGFYANLLPSLREELLPLTDPDEIRAAAQHCIENNWGQRALRRYVKGLRAKLGTTRTATPAQVAAKTTAPLARLTAVLGSVESITAFAKAAAKLPDEERARAKELVDDALTALVAAKKALK